MHRVQLIPIEPTYRKDNGMVALGLDDYNQLIDFPVRDRTFIVMPPQQFGGNHSHPRTEAFIVFGKETELHWIDDEGTTHIERMNPDGKLQINIVYPGTPHAVRNASATETAYILEFADAAQTLEDVTREQVIAV